MSHPRGTAACTDSADIFGSLSIPGYAPYINSVPFIIYIPVGMVLTVILLTMMKEAQDGNMIH